MATVNETFVSAPRGRRVVYPLLASIIAAIVGLGVALFFAWQKHGYALPFVAAQTPGPVGHAGAVPYPPLQHPPAPWANASMFLAPVLAALIGIPTYFRELRLTAGFKIEENRLVYGKKEQPLAGLIAAERDPQVLKGARKVWGNSGLGAIRGSFRSKRLGKFEAFLTDTEHAVVLRWPDKVLVVSPADPEFFIYSARRAAALT